MLKEEIGLRIKKLREERHLTKEAFAKKLGISGQYLGIIERGQNCLSVEKLKKLCDFTNQSSDYILFGKEYKFDSSVKDTLSDLSDEDIKTCCEALEKLALIMKRNKEQNNDNVSDVETYKENFQSNSQNTEIASMNLEKEA